MRQRNHKIDRPSSYVAIAIALMLAVGGCGSHAAPTTAAATQANAAPQLVKVGNATGVSLDTESVKLAGITVAKVARDDLSASTAPTGEIAPTDSGTVQVTSRLPGKITEALINVGDRVRKGEVIAEVDSVDLANAEAAYQTTVSHAALAQHQLAQQRKLAGYGALSEQPVEDARKAAFAADAAVGSDEAQIKVDKLALTSTQQLVAMGEITRKPLEDAQNAIAAAQSAASQAASTLHSTKSTYDRAVILFNGGVFSRQQLEDAETAYNSARASDTQAKTAARLANEELLRQQAIFKRNLNGASSLQAADSKVQQDEHAYQNDLVAQQLAHKEYLRARTVRKSGIPISQALQAAEDAYSEARIAVQSAANTLRIYGVQPSAASGELQNGHVVVPIVSPINGIVAARSMVVGQNTDTSTPLARLVNLDSVYVEAQVYEKDIQGVAIGDSVRFHVAAFPDRAFYGSVEYVADEVSADTRTVLVRTVLRNPGWILRPGMFASLVIGNNKGAHKLAVPADAVIQEGDNQVVYVRVAPGQFVKRSVKAGPPVDGKAPIQSGLAAGDQVVVGGNVLLQKAQEQLESGKSDAQ
ncbi:MAG: efflux RND transporter periplasmic adaptor subunit [Fimbriimonadaceae bacterium]